MNLPNKLTILRMVLIPFFVLFLLAPLFENPMMGRHIALVIFIAASITDTLDGYIARKHNMITDFGKFMDPLADKLLVCAALICLVSLAEIPAWIVIVIISREFIISGFRLIAADNGIVIAASWWGKVKTICQMVMIIVILLHFSPAPFRVLEQVLVWASLVLTVVSLLDYLIKNRSVLSHQK